MDCIFYFLLNVYVYNYVWFKKKKKFFWGFNIILMRLNVRLFYIVDIVFIDCILFIILIKV